MAGKSVDQQAEEKAKPEIKPFPMNSCKLREQNNLTYRLDARGVSLEELTNPERWAVIGSKLRAFDEVMCIGDEYIAEVIVIDSEPGYGTVTAIMHSIPFPTILKPMKGECPPGTYIDFCPLQHKYTGRRKSDGNPMTAPHPSRKDALNELQNHAVFR